MVQINQEYNNEGKIIKGNPIKVLVTLEKSTKGITRGGYKCKPGIKRYKVWLEQIYINYMKENNLEYITPKTKKKIVWRDKQAWINPKDFERFMSHLEQVKFNFDSNILQEKYKNEIQ